MVRYLIALALLIGGVVWLVLDAPLIGRSGLLESQPLEYTSDPSLEPDFARYRDDFLHDPSKYCDLTDPLCQAAVATVAAAGRPTPPTLDPRTEEILMQDPAIKAMVGNGERNVDYWLSLTPFGDPGHGDGPGMLAGAIIVFAEPVSWEGTVNTASQPCAGHGVEGHVDPDDPCRLVEREFGTVSRTITDVRVIHAKVFIRHGLVTSIYGYNPSPNIIEGMIEQFESEWEQAEG